MDVRRLRAFVTVAELGGITPAAEKLGYVQSSVSAQLRALEQDYGVRLLHRSNTGVELTDAGRALLPYATDALELDERMRRAVRGQRPSVRIGALESLAEEWLPDILAAFEHGAAGPSIGADVTLSMAGRDALTADLGAGRLDLIFLYDNGIAATTGPRAVVGSDPVYLVAAPEHPLSTVDRVTVDMLLDASFVVAEPRCASALLVDRFGKDLMHRVPISMVTGSLSALRRMVGHGRGVALLPQVTATRYVRTGELVRLNGPAGISPVTIEARWRPGLGPAETAVHALVRLAKRNRPQSESELTTMPAVSTVRSA